MSGDDRRANPMALIAGEIQSWHLSRWHYRRHGLVLDGRRITGYRLRFNLAGRPRGRSAPANMWPDADHEVWGVLHKITGRDFASS